MAAIAALPALSAAPAALQVITAVVNLSVPAGAFDPTTGKATVTVTRGLILQVQSNNSWKLRMRSTSANFSYTTQPGAGISKPVSDLQLVNVGTSKTLVPATSYLQIANGGNTHGWSEYAFDVIFQATTGDAGGLYTVNLEFNLY